MARIWAVLLSFFLVLQLSAKQIQYSQPHSFDFQYYNIKRGWAVGFKSLLVKDSSRAYQSKSFSGNGSFITPSSRPIQISVWYPTEFGSDGEQVTILHYRLLSDVEKKLADWTETERARLKSEITQTEVAKGRTPESVNTLLCTRTGAILNARIANGKFPLIIYSPSMIAGVQGNTILYEFLASQGYIVAAHPSFGEAPKMMDTGMIGLNTQIRDMEFVLGYMKNEFGSHTSSIGLMGHSWGGMAAVVAAMRHPDVQAVLSLDSSAEQWSDLVFAQPDYDVTKLRVPFMHIETKDNSHNGFYETIRYAPKYRICFPTLGHFDVVSANYFRAFDSDEKLKLYREANKFIVAFFNAYLINSHGLLSEVVENRKTSDNNFKIEWSIGKKSPPAQSELVGLITTGRIPNAEQIIRDFKEEDPESYSEKELLQIGELVFWSWKHFPEALQIFMLAREYYPKSARILEMIGNVHSSIDNKALALEFYKHSLTLNPENLRVIGYIQSIQSQNDETVSPKLNSKAPN